MDMSPPPSYFESQFSLNVENGQRLFSSQCQSFFSSSSILLVYFAFSHILYLHFTHFVYKVR
uniref:Uncharacterized protein n=1 Tax=Meloidogyne enterolobii TaxID=390850 RepID=A0A6V7UAH6_MELEN|nr:unnamed protein product [Meloidogyne enterolobii]